MIEGGGRDGVGVNAGVEGVAGLVVDGEHFARDLGVTGLVGAYEAELVSADVGGEAVEEEEAADEDENDEFAGVGEVGVLADGVEPAGEQRLRRGGGRRFAGRSGLGGRDHARLSVRRNKGSRDDGGGVRPGRWGAGSPGRRNAGPSTPELTKGREFLRSG